MAPIFDIMRVAAKTELKIPEMLQNMLNGRVQGMMTFFNVLTKNVSLREGLTPEDAAVSIWVLTSGEASLLYIENRSWTEKKYKHWMVDALVRLLLP